MTDVKIVNEAKLEFMFFTFIDYILQVKTGPFHEHSTQLWNISGVESWTKMNTGLVKMYKAEVLAKYPIIQHVVFGSLLSIEKMNAAGARIPQAGAFGVGVPPGPRPQPPLFTPQTQATIPTEGSTSAEPN